MRPPSPLLMLIFSGYLYSGKLEQDPPLSCETQAPQGFDPVPSLEHRVDETSPKSKPHKVFHCSNHLFQKSPLEHKTTKNPLKLSYLGHSTPQPPENNCSKMTHNILNSHSINLHLMFNSYLFVIQSFSSASGSLTH